MSDHAHGAHEHAGFPDPHTDPKEFWEERYGSGTPVWSGKVNTALESVARELTPGTALDLGSGEGGDVLWLASQGWTATGYDLSENAVALARAAARTAEAAGTVPADRAFFEIVDLSEWAAGTSAGDVPAGDRFDLVTASFLQSPVVLARTEVLRAAAAHVAPGGHLCVVAHAEPPQWVRPEAMSAHQEVPTPESDLAALALDREGWTVEIAEVRTREGLAPTGEPTVWKDSVVLVRRNA